MADLYMRLKRDVLVVEGGMGSVFSRYGVKPGKCPEFLNIAEPDLIEEIHRYYKLAGSQCAVTNTYGASRVRLSKLGYEDQFEDFNLSGVEIAQSINPQHVLANIGPCGIRVDSKDSGKYDEAYAEYCEQSAILARRHPDAIFIQTMSSIYDAECAVKACRETVDVPIIVSCVFGELCDMPDGTKSSESAKILEEAGADCLGINCQLDPNQIIEPAVSLISSTDLPVLVMPDVSHPVKGRNGETTYNGSPDLMADAAFELRKSGASLIGSCCGSTPAYTGAIFAAVGNTSVVAA